MKKYLSFLVMGLIAVLPLGVRAATTIDVTCGNADSNGNKTCVVSAETTETTLTVKLTEEGGADITGVNDGEWTISNQNESNGVWTIDVTGIDGGEINLFSFTYKVSGTNDCRIIVSLGDQTVPTIPDPDTPTEQKQTGSSLPYVALGAIAILAGGAYVTTKNKAKMYRL